MWATETAGKVYYYYSSDRIVAAAEILAPRREPLRKKWMTRAVRDTLAVSAITCVAVVAVRALSRWVCCVSKSDMKPDLA
jgi:hypothetical protein